MTDLQDSLKPQPSQSGNRPPAEDLALTQSEPTPVPDSLEHSTESREIKDGIPSVPMPLLTSTPLKDLVELPQGELPVAPQELDQTLPPTGAEGLPRQVTWRDPLESARTLSREEPEVIINNPLKKTPKEVEPKPTAKLKEPPQESQPYVIPHRRTQRKVEPPDRLGFGKPENLTDAYRESN